MKALGCLVIICVVLVSCDLALGFTFGVREIEPEDKSDGKVGPAEDTTSEVLKKVEDRIVSMKESLIRDINNQESEETNLIQNLRNSTSKSLKIVGNKVVHTEEKIVSTGTKDNATIAIYKIIKFHPLVSSSSEAAEPKAQKSNSDSTQSSDQAPETSEKDNSDSDQISEQASETVEKSDSNSHQSSDEIPETSDTLHSIETLEKRNSDSETSDESTNEVVNSENTQPAENQSSPVVQANLAVQNETAAGATHLEIRGPDGVLKPVRGIAIKMIPKTDDNIYSNVEAVPVQASNGLEDSEGSHSQGEGLVTNYWQPAARDLSKDTLINDRMAQQQASAGIVKIDPDAEFIDPAKHKGHIAQDSRRNYKFDRQPVSAGTDRDVEAIEPGNHNFLDQTPAPDFSSDLLIDGPFYDNAEKRIYKLDSDNEVIDPEQSREYTAPKSRINFHPNQPSGILSRFGADRDTERGNYNRRNKVDQTSAGADLSRDILVNEHAANGVVTADPDSEFISSVRPTKVDKNYYQVPRTAQQAIDEDSSRDTSITFESLVEPQVPSGTMMIEPYGEYSANRRFRRPSQDFYPTNADRFQRTPQRDLSGDTAVNDYISQQQSVSGLVMIDPDAELIDTGANQRNNVYYYYVPNNIDQVPRMKRTQPVYQFYQRPVVRYQYPQQPIMYY